MIQLPYFLTSKNKYWLGALGFTLSTSLYALTNQYQITEPLLLHYGELNEKIPFLPWTIWIYITHGILFVCAYIQAKDLKNLNRFFYAYIAMQILTCSVFLFFPTTFPRELFPLKIEDFKLTHPLFNKLTFFTFETVRGLDSPTNCFPSQHVASVYLFSFIFLKDRKYLFPFYFTWATLITISTVTTKQHYLLDIPAGFMTSVLCYYLFCIVFNKERSK